MINKDVEKLLLKVQKPGRYVGGELNSVVKNIADVDVRFAFCFPDTYEIGMSHLGMKILYSIFNNVPYIWCERVFAPWLDMEELMIEKNIPLFGLDEPTSGSLSSKDLQTRREPHPPPKSHRYPSSPSCRYPWQ